MTKLTEYIAQKTFVIEVHFFASSLKEAKDLIENSPMVMPDFKRKEDWGKVIECEVSEKTWKVYKI